MARIPRQGLVKGGFQPEFAPGPTRREFLALTAAGALLTPSASAQTTDPKGLYRDYARCLPDFLSGLAEAAYQRRNAEIARLTTSEAISARQHWVRETFWKLVGGRPERTPLSPRTIGSFERAGYRVEKVVYESQPDLHVAANLYVPTKGKPPYPGVLFQMGHSPNGKAAAVYQQCCQGLARLGYLVLAFDPMGQGERVYYPGASPSRSRLGPDEEHTYPGRQMLLKGLTSTRLQTWDSVRSLDYLASHPLVDPERLASTGQSGGGTTTLLLAAVDDRLAAAAPCCAITENFACANFIPPGSTDDAEQDLIASGPAGIDRWDLLYPLAPKPLLVLVSERDFFGTYSPNYIASGTEEFRKLRAVYQRLGHPERLAWYGSPLPHGLSYAMRLQIYSWFGRWLKGDSQPVTVEPETAPEPDSTLHVSGSGSVVRSFQGETPFTLLQKHAVARRSVDLAGLLGVDRPGQEVRATTLATSPFPRMRVEALEFPSALKVWVPAWLFLPEKSDPGRPLLIVLEPSGRGAATEGVLSARLAEKGCAACAPDLRGVGDATPQFGRGAARHGREHNNEEHYSWSSLILGKPLLGQRVTDLLAVIRGLRARPDLAGRRLVIAARGPATVPALCAAALEPSVDALYLAGGLSSFRSIAVTERYAYPFGNFVAHWLEHTDLPDLARALTSTRLVLAGTVDAAGRKLAPEAVRQEYGDSPNVHVLRDPLWTPESLLNELSS
jgi:dienelactone hydrolase